MRRTILVVNAGSSSTKFGLYSLGSERRLTRALHGEIEGIGTAPRLWAKGTEGNTLIDRAFMHGASLTHEDLFTALLDFLAAEHGEESLVAVGHRVVHGGRLFLKPVIVDPKIVSELEKLTPLAPLHEPHNLAPMRAFFALRPNLPQVACFDTAFHRTLSDLAGRFALPRELEAEGIRRYGFHGLSYEWISRRLRTLDPKLAEGRVIVAHLGSGASLCAMRAGESVDTSMGFTALDGLMMGTRCGSIDPGVILYLLQQRGMAPNEVSDLLYHRSGLLGVSGISSDMRVLLASNHPNAQAAIALFVFRIVREAGALVSTLGGLDGFVFTAGIGENAAPIRARVAEGLCWLGARLDDASNRAASPPARISAHDSRIALWVIPTDEEAMIAEHTLALISGKESAGD
jgi:acetate kinase